MKKNTSYLFYYFKEIKYRISITFLSFFISFFISYWFYFEYLYIFIAPFSRIFIFTEMSEMVAITLRLSLWIAFFFSFPYSIYTFICFISPSVSKNKKILYFKKFISFSFFLCGEIFIAFIFIPLLFHFFSGFEIKSFIYTIAWEIRIDSYFRFVSFYWFLLNFIGVIFYFCYLSLSKNKLITLLRIKNKKNIWFFFLLFGAFLAPLDIFYQLLLSSFLYFSFEFFLFFILIFHKYKNLRNRV